VLTSAFFITIVGLTIRAHRKKPATGYEGLVNMTGTAITDIDPEGKVFVHGEYWNAQSMVSIEKGAAVRVVKVKDMVLEVEKVPKK
jgi:membrane-bound serine protease (ClpP class)